MTLNIHRARNFLRRSAFEKIWFLPTWLLLGISRFAIKIIPFRHLAPGFGRHSGITVWMPILSPLDEARALCIARVVQMAARYTPWESNCFPQAITARILLGLYGIPYGFFFGFTAGTPMAHAWVAAGRIRVTGGESFSQFTVVSCFISPDLATPRK